MHSPDLAAITERVRVVSERIQPLLTPHPGLARRNAYAHVWLGLKVVFGEDWRERAAPASVLAFLDWVDRNPNGEYEAYDGPAEFLTPQEQGRLF